VEVCFTEGTDNGKRRIAHGFTKGRWQLKVDRATFTQQPVKKIVSLLLWCGVALIGAGAYATIALYRGEGLNSIYILAAALCTYAIGYRFYSKWIAASVLALDSRRATPCEIHDDGKDFVRTNKWIVFGHHFAAISGPGPLVGPVLAAQFGYLPGTLWILIGVVLGGAVQDFVILCASIRRDGRSLAQMVHDEINSAAGVVGLIGILSIMIILLAVLALVVVNALAESPWGVFTVTATIPIAMCMGAYLRFARIGKVLEVSVAGVVLLLLAVWGGQYVHAHEAWASFFKLRAEPIAWAIIGYGLCASILPVWLLLAPRDYLSTFMKLGTIAALALGVALVLPDLRMPALSRFVDGSGPIVPGGIFPFCFITIACGAISGFHTLIASGTTPKIITREGHARPIGYGAMCLESLVAIMAMIAACTLEPGIYLSMNIKGAPQQVSAVVAASGFHADPAAMTALAQEVGETSLYGRTGGAATLAVGMAQIFARLTQGRWIDLWYHFAIMFEALFILTTLDAGTRVGRYLLQDALGRFWQPLGDTRSVAANWITSLLMVASWGAFLIMGVRDPEGGVKALWPIFGIANQMLASIALCLATTVLLKMQLARGDKGRPALALITAVPLCWLLAVTGTASVQKVFHPNPRIGFLAAANAQDGKRSELTQRLAAMTREVENNAASASATAAAVAAARKALHDNETIAFNSRIDAFVTATFLVLVALITIFSVREWLLLLSRRKPARMSETPPVLLPSGALGSNEPSAIGAVSALAFSVTMIKEISGAAAIDRAEAALTVVADARPGESEAACECRALGARRTRQNAYLTAIDRRFHGVSRCC
jgi:carbon starvation protein